jgi:hypothetical protein
MIPPILLTPGLVDASGQGEYTAHFDARRIPEEIQFPTFVVTARDLLGNESQRGHEFAIDDVQPILDLDPPLSVLYRNNVPCSDYSIEFATLGSTARRDLVNPTVDADPPAAKVPAPQIVTMRALAVDYSRRRPGSRITIDAGIDEATLRFYVLDDTSQPLAVDTDGDGICDDVNPEVVPRPGIPPMPGRAFEIRLASVPPGGTAQFESPPTCDLAPPPPFLTQNTGDSLTVAVQHGDGFPALYAPVPVDDNRNIALALGNDVDLANNISNGWVCVVAAGSDRLGNTGVSAPLRLCLCRDWNPGDPPCDECNFLPDVSSAPNCTGTALPGQPVSSNACTPLRATDAPNYGFLDVGPAPPGNYLFFPVPQP